MISKYQRTLHFPFSPEIHSDDKIQYNLENLIDKEIIISEKLDGGNTGINRENVFARSHSSPAFCSSFDYIKSMHYYPKKHLLNKDYFYFGENLYAIHSIEYTNLKDYFYLFAIRNKTIFLSYDDIIKEAKRLEFETVPTVFKGIFKTEKKLKDFLDNEITKESFLGGDREGFVVRTRGSFLIEDFAENVVKYVRKGHVQTDEHWSKKWKKNKLIKG
jgi:hypothetical protein